jgi:hypothetical protein
MTPTEIKDARHELGLSQWQLATLLGFIGEKGNRRRKVDDMETGVKPPSGPVIRLLIAYLEGYRPSDWDDIVSGRLRPTTEHEFQ